MTVWRKIPGLPERFEASSEGQIRTLPYEVAVPDRRGDGVRVRKLPGRVLQQRVATGSKSKGHPIVTIWSKSATSKCIGEQRVALLVARAFHGCPYPPGGDGGQRWRVRHIDGDVLNIRAANLEWIANVGAGKDLYHDNLRALSRDESVEDWATRIFGYWEEDG